jgi:hypothetical protein
MVDGLRQSLLNLTKGSYADGIDLHFGGDEDDVDIIRKVGDENDDDE